MSERQTPNGPPDQDSGKLPIDDVPGLAELILFLDGIGMNDAQIAECHGLLADIHGMDPDDTMSRAAAGMPAGPKPGGAAMDAARTGRFGTAHARPLTDRERLEQRFPSMPKARRW